MKLFAKKTPAIDPEVQRQESAYRARRTRIIETAHSIFCYELSLDESPSEMRIHRLAEVSLNSSEEFWEQVEKRFPEIGGD